jgi:hypothetical protein
MTKEQKLRWNEDTILAYGKIFIGCSGYHLMYNEGKEFSDIHTRRRERNNNILSQLVGDKMPFLMELLEQKVGGTTKRRNGTRNGRSVLAEFDNPSLLISSRLNACCCSGEKNELIPMLLRQSFWAPIQFICNMIDNGRTIDKYDLFKNQEQEILSNNGDGAGFYVWTDCDDPKKGYIGESKFVLDRGHDFPPSYYISKIYPTINKDGAKLIQDAILWHFSDPKKYYRQPGTRGHVIVLDGTPIHDVVDQLMKTPALNYIFHSNIRTIAKPRLVMPPLIAKILTEHAKRTTGEELCKSPSLITPERDILIVSTQPVF